MDLVNLDKGLTVDQLDELIGSRDHLTFLNPRNARYREMGLKSHPPSREEALRLMAETPNLIRRPLSVHGESIVLGYSADDLDALCRDREPAGADDGT